MDDQLEEGRDRRRADRAADAVAREHRTEHEERAGDGRACEHLERRIEDARQRHTELPVNDAAGNADNDRVARGVDQPFLQNRTEARLLGLAARASEFQEESRNSEENDPVKGEDQKNGRARFRPETREDDRQAEHDGIALPAAEAEHDRVRRGPAQHEEGNERARRPDGKHGAVIGNP